MKYFLFCIALFFFVFLAFSAIKESDLKIPQEDVTIDLKIKIDE